MPRWNPDASQDAAAQAVRQRFASRLAPEGSPPLLDLPEEDRMAGDHAASPPRLRWRTPWRAVVVVLLGGVLLLVWFFWQARAGQMVTEPVSQPPAATEVSGPEGERPGTTTPGTTTPTAQLLVHVSGAVPKPGVVSLPQGSRVFQAIEAAGGPAPGARLDQLNLAATVTDGAKIHVPVAGEAPPAGVQDGSTGPTPADGPGNGINLNSASAEELGTLPGVGPVMAQRIVDWRKEHGPFSSVDELDAVSGVGPKLMEQLRDLVTVQGG